MDDIMSFPQLKEGDYEVNHAACYVAMPEHFFQGSDYNYIIKELETLYNRGDMTPIECLKYFENHFC